MEGEGEMARFRVKASLGGGTCSAEGALTYVLPSGLRLEHRSDILLSLPTGKHVALEMKFQSAVTDQFKARSYDMLHLKQALGTLVVGIMVYVHMPGKGIRTERARAISYPFDYFFGLEAADLGDPHTWTPLIETVKAEVLAS